MELEDEFIDKFKNDVNEADVLWVDEIVKRGGMEWTLEHIHHLCHKLRYVIFSSFSSCEKLKS